MITKICIGLFLVLLVAGVIALRCYVRNCFSKAFSEVFSMDEDTSLEKEIIDQLTDRYEEKPQHIISIT